ncbi:Asp23/Gls24 family envelope stress response protein [Listeria ilorinensis]|uniref:Asp23/Gls24 family envelope stress response protein n=1 Tax=Listeria ilorinensis TaxID=2867439 RepID=UPI001EF6A0C0|nr:Asp23/Gls24 family envelope stress response protein [Listeria ilorinensis]
MAYTKDLRKDPETLGKIEIAPEVIGVIAGLAASEVENVGAMQGGFASEMREKFGGTVNYRKGVKIELTENGILVDLYCSVLFGATIPLVAEGIQAAVRDTIFSMTGLVVAEVNVHIVGVQFEKTDVLSLDDFTL